MLNQKKSQDSKQLFELGVEDAASFKSLWRAVSLQKRMKKERIQKLK